MRKRLVGTVTAGLLLLGASAVQAAPGSADCDVDDDSTFTVGADGYYAWVWREGKRIRGYGWEYLDAEIGTKTLDSPTNWSGSGAKKFGVLWSGSSSYQYVDCT